MTGNKQPLVSICVPAYNHEKYVAECIEAAINQTYPNIELLIIDDGSKDKTWEIICSLKEKAEKRFKRVVFKTQKNKGTATTFGELFKQVKGEYICLCASDDKFSENAIEKLYEFISAHDDVGLVVGQNLIMDSDSRVCFWNKRRDNVYDKKDAVYESFTKQIESTTKIKATSDFYGEYETLIKSNHIANGWMFRKSLLNQIVPFEKEAPLEDWWFMLQIAKVSKIKAIDDVTFYYRWHGANTASQDEKMKAMTLKTLLYEKQEVSRLKDKRFLDALNKAWYGQKNIFDLGLIKMYQKMTPTLKTKVLEIFGHEFILKSKKVL